MNFEDYKRIADSASERQGWDFSRMKVDCDPVPWDYKQVAARYLKPTDQVLDVGTGGGETFLQLAPHVHSGIGIDLEAEMVATARRNLGQTTNVRFEQMSIDTLRFENERFDVVLNRQAPISEAEITRVLKVNGYFITQQIGRWNMQNILEAFGWDMAHLPQAKGIETYAESFKAHGCVVVAQGEYNVPYFVSDIESLIFWLKAILHRTATGFPETFDIERHWPVIDHLISTYQTPRGIATNEHRQLLVVQKT